MIESKLEEAAMDVLKKWDKELSEEEAPKVSSTLSGIEKDLDREFESLVDSFKDKIGDVGGAVGDKKDEILKKAMEKLVKSL